MDLDLAQLRALAATVRGGMLETAARELHVTPSAISQRLRALEVATGRIPLVRTKPVQVTESGQAVLRLARQVDLLAADVVRELGGDETSAVPTLPIAVNADSTATWVLPALAPLAGEVCFELHREDQEHTSALLRAGTVMAALTTDAEPVPGYLRAQAGSDIAPPAHHVPAAADHVSAITLGLGWGRCPSSRPRRSRRDSSPSTRPTALTWSCTGSSGDCTPPRSTASATS